MESQGEKKQIVSALLSAPIWIPVCVAIAVSLATGIPWLYANFVPRAERDGAKAITEKRLDNIESEMKELTQSNAELKGTINTFMSYEAGKKR